MCPWSLLFSLLPVALQGAVCGAVRKVLLRALLSGNEEDSIGKCADALVDGEGGERARAERGFGGAADADGDGGGAPPFVCEHVSAGLCLRISLLEGWCDRAGGLRFDYVVLLLLCIFSFCEKRASLQRVSALMRRGPPFTFRLS